MVILRERLRAAYEAACCQEIEALKPGNVHVFAAGHNMSVEQFLESARASSGPLTDPSLPCGARTLEAVRATRQAVGVNTNLGVVLLCAPLLCAAERGAALQASLGAVLSGFDMDDARAVFAAIAHAQPGGLGESENDVRQPPAISLLDAMSQAADRDMIARQYVTDFADMFEVGLPALDEAAARGETGMWPTVFAYMAFLSRFPDSHVGRKWGVVVAERVRQEGSAVLFQMQAALTEAARLEILMAFDQRLKTDAINPGTSADLTVASLLLHNLHNLREPLVSF